MIYAFSRNIGIAIVCLVAILTLVGPQITPRDPRERNVVTKTADGYRAPPFAIGTPGFSLGSDQYGRDLLSRMIAGTQPTMLTVLVVATFRIIIGTLIGLASSFGGTFIARMTQLLIRGSMYLPQLFGALLVLVLAGNNPTLGFFVTALVWSGWGDVAQIVQQRSNEFRQLPVYESAMSSGASTQSILIRHIRRHLAPIWGMMWLREMSNSLALLAMLGFLGYFVGGASWIIVAGDAVPIGARAADIPELGQLLATSFERVLQPQPMFLVGGYIALIVLGFNLLGDVVRTRLSYLPQHTHFGVWQRMVFDLEWWMSRLPGWQVMTIAFIVLFSIPAGYLLRPTPPLRTASPQSNQMIWQGEGAWRDGRGDSGASMRGINLTNQPQLTTLVPPPAPLISAALATKNGVFVAYSETPGLLTFSTVTQQWSEHPLKFTPVGNPALTHNDEIVVVGPQGFVAHYDVSGKQLRSYAVTTRALATAGATIGATDEVYITVIDRIEAFDANGVWLWATPKVNLFGDQHAQISPDGTLIFLGGEAFDIVDGARLPMFVAPASATFENPLLISGANGIIYQRRSHRLVQLDVKNFVPTEIAEIGWNANQVTMFYPEQTGVTAQGIGWMVYKGFGGIGRFVWLPANQEAIQIPIDTSMRVMLVADDGQFIACNARECISHTIGGFEPIWQMTLPQPTSTVWGMSVINTQSVLLATESQLLVVSQVNP
ncbi:MAG: ABC transporter permease [Roseiflexaceae bacterium]